MRGPFCELSLALDNSTNQGGCKSASDMRSSTINSLEGVSVVFFAGDADKADIIESILADRQIKTACTKWTGEPNNRTNFCDLVVWSKAALQNSDFVDFAISMNSQDALFQVCFDGTRPPDPMRSLNCLQLPSAGFNAEYADQLCHAINIILREGSHSKEPLFTLSTRVARKFVAMELTPANRNSAIPPTQKKQSFTMGPWRIDPASNYASMGEPGVKISTKAMDILVLLANNQGEVLSMDQILTNIWGETIVGDDSVHRCISELRRCLNDSARAPSYIETISKRGYRIIAPIEWDV